MTGVLSGLGCLLLASGAVVGVALLPDWLKHYYGQPEEPTLLDAPRAAGQARQAGRAAEPDAGQSPLSQGGA